MRSPDHRVKTLRAALVSVASEIAQATSGPDTEEALDEAVGRIAHIAARAVMTTRDQAGVIVSWNPMMTRCPDCGLFHSPGHCS